MYRGLCVTSLLVLLLLFSCKPKEVPKTISNPKSVQGLLSGNDTMFIYNDVGLKRLSDYDFFKKPLNTLIPIDEWVIPYELNSPLFTDYASKKRFISLPNGTTLNYADDGVLEFPKGTIIIKNFYYKKDELKSESSDVIIESRLLIKDSTTSKWTTLPYIWNEDQTEAYLYILGKDIDLTIEKGEVRKNQITFKYSVPNVNMCKNCHVKNQDLVPLGPTARQLNRNNIFNDTLEVNQLSYLSDNKMLIGLPSLSKIARLPNYAVGDSGNLNARARAYLDVNCAHCHRVGGSAKTSGLNLNYSEINMYKVGVNKSPVAAGGGSGNLSYDIVPGHPEKSILLYRMQHLEPDIMMPEIGKNLLDEKGVKLIEEWITSLTAH